MNALVVKGLRVSVREHFWQPRRTLLEDVSFLVQAGSVVGFLGPNGSGKTTTLRAILGLARPEAGSIEILGGTNRNLSIRRQLGFMPERPYFPEHLSGFEVVLQHALLAGQPWGAARRQARELLARVGLAAAEAQALRTYSKGMLQRLGFAQALVGAPRLLLLDEPMSDLDPLGRRDLRELIGDVRRSGSTVFFSTHILPDVEIICDHVIILQQGRVLRSGRLDELLARQVSGVEVVAEGLTPADEARLAGLAQVAEKRGPAMVFVLDNLDSANRLVDAVRAAGGRLVGLDTRRPSLEDVFVATAAAGPKDAVS